MPGLTNAAIQAACDKLTESLDLRTFPNATHSDLQALTKVFRKAYPNAMNNECPEGMEDCNGVCVIQGDCV